MQSIMAEYAHIKLIVGAQYSEPIAFYEKLGFETDGYNIKKEILQLLPECLVAEMRFHEDHAKPAPIKDMSKRRRSSGVCQSGDNL